MSEVAAFTSFANRQGTVSYGVHSCPSPENTWAF